MHSPHAHSIQNRACHRGRKEEAGLETNLRDGHPPVGRIATLGPGLLLGQFCTLLLGQVCFLCLSY